MRIQQCCKAICVQEASSLAPSFISFTVHTDGKAISVVRAADNSQASLAQAAFEGRLTDQGAVLMAAVLGYEVKLASWSALCLQAETGTDAWLTLLRQAECARQAHRIRHGAGERRSGAGPQAGGPQRLCIVLLGAQGCEGWQLLPRQIQLAQPHCTQHLVSACTRVSTAC